MKESMRQKIEVLDDRFQDAYNIIDGMTREKFITGCMKEDGISREEVMEKIAADPMYSWGLKRAIYKNHGTDLRVSRKEKKRRFLESLSPEEMEFEMKYTENGYWKIRRMEKAAKKAAEKEAEAMKEKIATGEISSDPLDTVMNAAMEAAENEES